MPHLERLWKDKKDFASHFITTDETSVNLPDSELKQDVKLGWKPGSLDPKRVLTS